jgi:hypothetical protein
MILLLTVAVVIMGIGSVGSQFQCDNPGTTNGVEMADGLPQCDGTRQA